MSKKQTSTTVSRKGTTMLRDWWPLGVALLCGLVLGSREYMRRQREHLRPHYMVGVLKFKEPDPNEKRIDQG
jgi:uncharacterized membrane protein affecting hemolysin expression